MKIPPLQYKFRRDSFNEDKILIVTPGIRPVENRQTDDQKRVVTVERAFQDGADYIVVGRPIQNADNPREAAELIQESISNSI